MALRMISDQRSIEREQLKIATEVLSRFPLYNVEANAWVIINGLEAEGKPVTSQNIREAFVRFVKGTTLVKKQPNVRDFFNVEAAALPYRGVTANESIFGSALNANPQKSIHEVFQQIKHQLGFNRYYDEAWREFKSRHTNIQWNEAIIQRLNELQHQRIVDGAWPDEDVFITANALEQLLPQVANELSLTPEASQTQSETREREQLIAELLNVKRFRDDQTGRIACFDENGRKAFVENYTLGLDNGGTVPVVGYRERIESTSLEELRAIRDRRAGNRNLQTKTKDELREIVKQEADTSRQALADSRYAPIPSRYTPPGKDESVSVPWSAKLLRKLPSGEVRRIIRLFGAEAVNSACGIG